MSFVILSERSLFGQLTYKFMLLFWYQFGMWRSLVHSAVAKFLYKQFSRTWKPLFLPKDRFLKDFVTCLLELKKVIFFVYLECSKIQLDGSFVRHFERFENASSSSSFSSPEIEILPDSGTDCFGRSLNQFYVEHPVLKLPLEHSGFSLELF